MWVYRLGLERAKRILLTGDLISSKTAEKFGLISHCFSKDEFENEIEKLTLKMKSIPINQLQMQKLVVNQIYTNMGLNSTQILSTLFDGFARHSPEGLDFKNKCEEFGFKKIVKERDQFMSKL